MKKKPSNVTDLKYNKCPAEIWGEKTLILTKVFPFKIPGPTHTENFAEPIKHENEGGGGPIDILQ
jgi:hypothetical protein